jgi:hypothetical protein
MNRKIIYTALILAALAASAIAAQETTDKPTAPLPTEEVQQQKTKLFNPGDKLFSISLGPQYPLFNYDTTEKKNVSPNLSLGGAASLEWSFFVLPNFALGGELGASFNFSKTGRALFIAPLTFKASYFFSSLPWEFPVSLGVGASIMTLSDLRHIDPFIKPEAGVYYRTSPDWSFGGTLSWWIIPQTYKDHPDQSRIANILDLSLKAIYHF